MGCATSQESEENPKPAAGKYLEGLIREHQKYVRENADIMMAHTPLQVAARRARMKELIGHLGDAPPALSSASSDQRSVSSASSSSHGPSIANMSLASNLSIESSRSLGGESPRRDKESQGQQARCLGDGSSQTPLPSMPIHSGGDDYQPLGQMNRHSSGASSCCTTAISGLSTIPDDDDNDDGAQEQDEGKEAHPFAVPLIDIVEDVDGEDEAENGEKTNNKDASGTTSSLSPAHSTTGSSKTAGASASMSLSAGASLTPRSRIGENGPTILEASMTRSANFFSPKCRLVSFDDDSFDPQSASRPYIEQLARPLRSSNRSGIADKIPKGQLVSAEAIEKEREQQAKRNKRIEG